MMNRWTSPLATVLGSAALARGPRIGTEITRSNGRTTGGMKGPFGGTTTRPDRPGAVPKIEIAISTSNGRTSAGKRGDGKGT